MYISDYIKRDFLNGEGVRTSIFISGCIHKCKNCFSYETWNFKNGKKLDEEFKRELVNNLNSPIIKGRLSILGGDGMFSAKELYELILELKKEVKSLNIWLWTGFTLDQIKEGFYYNDKDKENVKYRKLILEEINVLVDGKFVEELYSPSLAYRGSSNQKINVLQK